MRRRRVTVLIVTGIALAAGLVLALLPRTYAADGAIRVQPGTAGMYRATTAVASGVPADKIASEVVILQSRSLYLQVGKELNLANEPALWGKLPKTQSLNDPKIRQRLFEKMTAALKIEHTPKDEIISITCTTISPALSARIVNTLINDYVSYLFKMRYGSTQRAAQWLVGQLGDLKGQIESDQSNIVRLQGQLGVIGFDPRSSDYLATSSLDAYTKAASSATIERIVAEAKYRFLEEANPNLIEGEINLLPQSGPANPPQSLLESLRSSRAGVAATYANLSARFGKAYPDVMQAKAQLDELDRQVQTEQQRVMNQAKLAYQAASVTEKNTAAEAKSRKDQAFGARSDMLRYLTLINDYDTQRTLYGGLIQRLREAGITAGLEAGEIDIVDLADVPALPVPPGPFILLAASLVTGFIIGCLAAIGLEALDSHITTQEQVEKIAAVPLLAVIPHIRVDKKLERTQPFSALAAISSPRSIYTESIHLLRSTLLLTGPRAATKVIVLTSGAPHTGKSTIAANLAIVCATHGARVLLIDCDLRRGVVARIFGLGQEQGLTSVLNGQVALEDAVHLLPTVEGLSVLPSGPRASAPSVLVGSERMRALIDECKKRFDFVILDAPPLLGISDSLSLAASADSVVLVVRSKVSTKSGVSRMMTLLKNSQIPVTGVLLNDSRLYQERGDRRAYKGYYEDVTEKTV